MKKKGRREQHHTEGGRQKRFFFLWLPVIVCSIIFVYIVAFDPVDRASVKEVRGTVMEDGQRSAQKADAQTCRVKLPQDKVVTLSVAGSDACRRGRAVLVETRRTTLFNREAFDFIRFLD